MPGYEKDKAKVQDQLRRIEGLYRKYYGGRMSLYLLGVSYVAMVLAGLIIGALFQALGRVPSHHFVAVFQTHPTWNYTTFLNLAVLALIALLGWRFLRTGGPEMLRAMEISPDEKAKLATDPVCGMAVDRATAKETLEHDGTTYYFCSADDRKAFEKDPKHYLVLAGNPDRADSGSTTVDPVCGMTIDPLTAAGQATFEGETYFFCSAGCKTTFEENPDRYARGASVRQERGRANPFR